jgi:hypothetical protein
VITVGLTSCGSEDLPPQVITSVPGIPKSLSFNTISQGAPLGDHPDEPLYTVVIDASEWDELIGQLPQQGLSAGKQVSNTRDDVVIIVFAGEKGSSGYGIQIDSINLQGGEFTILVNENEPEVGEIKEPATTLPYQIVSLAREYLPQQELLIFSFIDEDGVLLNQMEVRLP